MKKNIFAPLFHNFKQLPFFLILFLGVFIRLVEFPNIPAGFNQDEAAIAYDSYSIMTYGIDRNGYHLPVYPVSWGAGQGPFYMYFAIPFMKLFGTGVFGFRIGNVLLSIASLVCIYFILKASFGIQEGLIAMFLFAISPWNIFLSRWSLDANPLPSLLMIALCFLFHGIKTGKTYVYLIAAFTFALSLYAYGASYVVIPLFLLLVIPYLYVHKKISLKQVLLSGALFFFCCIPLILFLLVNYFGLPEIKTNLFSVPRLTALRSASIFRTFENGLEDLISSFIDYYQVVLNQRPDHIWNSVSDYGIIYHFSFLLIFLGIGLVVYKCKFKIYTPYYLYLALFISCSLLVILIHPNVNRVHIVFIPILMMIALALSKISSLSRITFAGILVLYTISFLSFSKYYLKEYNNMIGPAFYESFDEAILYASESTDSDIYVSHNISNAHILTLFHTKADPYTFADTVVYYNEQAEFRHAVSFDRYCFFLPDIITSDACYVITHDESSLFSSDEFLIKFFKYYAVALPK